MWISTDQIRFDEVDGEPVCARCGGSLASRRRESEITVTCETDGCRNSGKILIVASGYSEITAELSVLRAGQLRLQ
jgi:hypothetical protein